jgi:hypothetical protein
MKSYSVALFIPLVLLISIGVAVDNLTEKPKKKLIKTSEVPEIVYDCNYYQAHHFHDSLNNHLDEYHSISEKQGIQPVEDESFFKAFIAEEKLVKVKTSDYFYLDSFNYSFPVLTPDAKDFLDTVGARFNQLIDKTPLKGSKLIVTSLTRTTSTVKRLVRVNRNASLRSPHLNGNSFDLSFNHFLIRGKNDPCNLLILQETISKVLYDLRKEKRCWVTFERRQQCLHVVARKSNHSTKRGSLKDFKTLFLQQ